MLSKFILKKKRIRFATTLIYISLFKEILISDAFKDIIKRALLNILLIYFTIAEPHPLKKTLRLREELLYNT